MNTTVDRESIRIIPPNEYDLSRKVNLYEWTCPGCGSTVHGDAIKDTIFEIRNDAICCYCRVKLGQLRISGSAFVRVPGWKPA